MYYYFIIIYLLLGLIIVEWKIMVLIYLDFLVLNKICSNGLFSLLFGTTISCIVFFLSCFATKKLGFFISFFFPIFFFPQHWYITLVYLHSKKMENLRSPREENALSLSLSPVLCVCVCVYIFFALSVGLLSVFVYVCVCARVWANVFVYMKMFCV